MWRKDTGTRTINTAEPDKTEIRVVNVGALEWPGAELGVLEWVYRLEIEHSLAELEVLTRGFQGQVSSLMAARVRDSLRVLSSCYQNSDLPTQALDVLVQHLRTLVQVTKQDHANTFS